MPERLNPAKTIQRSALHNMLNILKYYHKKGRLLDESIDTLQQGLERIQYVDSLENLYLEEARNKKVYYAAFDTIIQNSNFPFEQRSKNLPEMKSMP